MSERTIHMSGRPPVVINDREWPEIARAHWFDGATKETSRERAWVRVRRHPDGRMLIYGLRSGVSSEDRKVGYLVNVGASTDEIASIVRSTCAIVGVEEQAIFDSLPPEAV